MGRIGVETTKIDKATVGIHDNHMEAYEATIHQLVQCEIEQIQRAVMQLREAMQNTPQGSIKCDCYGKAFKYRIRNQEANSDAGWEQKRKTFRYLPVDQQNIAKEYVKRDYNKKLLAVLDRELSVLKGFHRSYAPQKKYEVYSTLSEARIRLVQPFFSSAEAWNKMLVPGNSQPVDLGYGLPDIETVAGFSVRSKSEALIVSELIRCGIAFEYERTLPLMWKNHPIRPDFTAANRRTGRFLCWEHFGKMNDPVYAADTVAKLRHYENNGFFLGDNLIATFESTENPLQISDINRKIQHFLL